MTDAENALQDANSSIAEGEPGYGLLQDAYAAYRNGSYRQAERLAGAAQDANTPESGDIPVIPVVVVLLLAVMAVLIYTQRERIRAVVGGEEEEERVEDPLGPVRTN